MRACSAFSDGERGKRGDKQGTSKKSPEEAVLGHLTSHRSSYRDMMFV